MSNENILSREKALYLMTKGAAWFSREEAVKGDINVDEIADFAMLSDDYFTVKEEMIKNIQSVMTVVAGRVVHGEGSPKTPRAIPEWSPVNYYGGYQD